MENNRKIKMLLIVALVFAISAMTLGFAAFSTTLNISSQASVVPNSSDFSVKFSTNKTSLVESPVVPTDKTTGISTTDGIINNGTIPKITNLSAMFTEPGDFVEYIVYVRNEGEYTAYLNNINFLGTKICTASEGTTDFLVQSACNSINITATIAGTTYYETTSINNHTLASKSGETLVIRLQYLSSGIRADGAFNIKFPDIALVYSTVNDPSVEPQKTVQLVSGSLDGIGSIVSIGDEQFYTIGMEGNNVNLLSMKNITLDDRPIQSSSAGSTAFSSDSKKGTNYSDYKNSIVEEYVNNYKKYLEGLGVNIVEARLITKEELDSDKIGCETSDYSCRNASPFIYATSYWVDHPSGTEAVWYVTSYGSFSDAAYWYDTDIGVRPVIVISKSEF